MFRLGSTAFGLRNAGAHSIWIGVRWKDRAASIPSLAWASETSRRLRSFSANRIYCNYQSFEGKGASEAVWRQPCSCGGD